MAFKFITPPVNFLQVPFRIASTVIVRVIARTAITPNQVTVARGVVVIFSLFLMASGQPGGFTVGAVLFYLFEVLDHVDGDLARFTNRKTKIGPLLEQFLDTIFARPSNLLGAAIAIGLFRATGTYAPAILYAVCAYGRMNWMEFRDYFGWKRDLEKTDNSYSYVIGNSTWYGSCIALAKIVYTWNNSFLLVPALIYDLIPCHWAEFLFVAGFVMVATINNLPWIAIVAKGFAEATKTRLKTPKDL